MFAADIDPVLPALVWQHTAQARKALHHGAGSLRCQTSVVPYSAADPVAGKVDASCWADGCFDLVHEILCRAQDQLTRRSNAASQPELREHVRYANVVVQHEVSEYERRQRSSRGMPAKPTRSDGPAARINAELVRVAGTTARHEWLLALFRMIRAYACRPDRPTSEWPLALWTAERLRISGADAGPTATSDDAATQSDIAAVIAVAERIVGTRWVHENVWHPLIVASAPRQIDERAANLPGSDQVEDGGLWHMFESAYLDRRRRDIPIEMAFRAAYARVFGAPPDGITKELRELLADIEHGADRGQSQAPARSPMVAEDTEPRAQATR